MLSDGRQLYIHKYESNASMSSSVIFYLKSVHFLFFFFLFSICSKEHKGAVTTQLISHLQNSRLSDYAAQIKIS